MARSNETLKFTGFAVAVIAVAFGVGYFVIGGPRSASPTVDTSQVPMSAPPPETKTVSQTRPPAAITPHSRNSDYTAPGAPTIHIAEDRTPSLTLHRTPVTVPPDLSPSTKSSDSEASQEAAPPTAASDTTSSSPSSGSSDPSGTSSAPLIPPPSSAPSAPSAPADQDFEQIGGHSSTSSSQDSTASSSSSGKAQFRVQSGSFATPENAKELADALHNKGYTTSTHVEQDNGKTVYKVQVGAYRTRAAADKAAQDLQKSGYPAYTAPIGQ